MSPEDFLIFDWDMSLSLPECMWTNFNHIPRFWPIVGLPLNLKISLLSYRLSWFRGPGRGRIRSHFRDSWPGRSPPPLHPAQRRSGGMRGDIVQGLALPVCQPHYTGRGVDREWKRQRMKQKMKERAYEREHDTESERVFERREWSLYSCTLNHITQVYVCVWTNTHTTYTHTAINMHTTNLGN